MQDATDFVGNREILRKIEKTYPSGSEKVTLAFAKNVLTALEHFAGPANLAHDPTLPVRFREILQKCKKGMRAIEFHSEVGRILNRIGIDSRLPQSDTAVGRLEKQLRELRMMVTEQPSDIATKFHDLQQQVATIREDMLEGRSTMADKQEDMLQKFLAAEKRAFIIMPFQRDFDNVWFGAIKPGCVECHYAPLRVDEVNLSSLITDDIERYSGMAGVVVVDLTGNNPNVMFELGWSLAKNKRPIVICQGDHSSKVAFDVRGIRHISYENSWLGIETLKKKLKDFITATDKQSPRKKTKVKRVSNEEQKTQV